VTQSAEPAIDSVETVSDTLAPLADSLADGGAFQTMRQVQEVTDTMQPVTQTVQEVTQTVQEVTQPVQEVIQPVQQVTQPVQEVTQPVTQTVQPVAEATTGAVGTAGQTAGSLTDAATVGTTAEKAAAETTAALSGASKPIHGAVGQVTESSALSDKAATIAGAGDGGGPGGGPGSVAENITPSGTGIAGGESASGSGGESAFRSGESFAGFPSFDSPGLIAGADEALIVTAGLATLAGVAVAVRPSAGLTTQFFLANVRQIPAVCGGARGTVNRQMSAAVAGTARFGAAAGGVLSSGLDVIAENFTQGVRDGFRGPGRPGTGTTDDGTSDTRLLMQIGMLLGTIYLAFLTVWFWATRLRWNPRT
jgi:uncharacterized protein YoxC